MSSAAALPSVKLRQPSLQERANTQPTPRSSDKQNIAFLACLGWGRSWRTGLSGEQGFLRLPLFLRHPATRRRGNAGQPSAPDRSVPVS